jgi:hypothetical protein
MLCCRFQFHCHFSSVQLTPNAQPTEAANALFNKMCFFPILLSDRQRGWWQYKYTQHTDFKHKNVYNTQHTPTYWYRFSYNSLFTIIHIISYISACVAYASAHTPQRILAVYSSGYLKMRGCSVMRSYLMTAWPAPLIDNHTVQAHTHTNKRTSSR